MSARCLVILIGLGACAPSLAYAGSCPEPATAEQLQLELDAAQSAVFSTGDKAQFDAAMETIEADLPCLGDRLGAAQIAELHLVYALQALVEGHSAKMVPSLHAALGASPSFALTQAQAPEGGPLRAALDDARALILTDSAAVDAPDCVGVWVDGQETRTLLTGRPVFVQLLSPDGDVLTSELVRGGQAPPTTGFVCPGLVEAAPSEAPSTRGQGRGRHVALGLGAAASAGAAGALLAAANRAENDFERMAGEIAADGVVLPTTQQQSEFDAFGRQANGFSAAAIGAGVVAVGLGATLVLTW